ncbi:MAG: hypothetical protein WCF99_15560 [Chloroflexales bacterium]
MVTRSWLAELEQRTADVAIALRDLYALARTRYAATKARADALDFDDLETMARDLLERHPLACRATGDYGRRVSGHQRDSAHDHLRLGRSGATRCRWSAR